MAYIISFIIAFVVAFSATPIAKKVAFSIGAVDMPGDKRRMHDKPIARLGGLAIVSGFLVSLLFQVLNTSLGGNTPFVSARVILGLLAGIFIVVGVGVADDIKRLPAKFKLLLHFAAAVAFVLISGTKIESVSNPFTALGYSPLPGYISYPLSILWIMGITNAINLIDGLDGLAAGVASISALSLFFVSILNVNTDIYTAIITATLAGCTLGFLPFNFNPAKIIMGDNGAYFLGFTLGAISIQGTLKSYATISIAIPLLVLGLPLLDTLFAIIRRVISRRPMMSADREHLHHKLIDMGLSHKQSVIVMYIASTVLGLCAIVLANKGVLSAIILLIVVSVFVIGGARYMSEINEETNSEESYTEESYTKETNIEESNTKETNIEESNTKETNIEESNTKETNIEESNTKETNIEETKGEKGEDEIK